MRENEYIFWHNNSIEMDGVKEKYTNFIKFLEYNLQGNTMVVSQLKLATCEQFLSLLKAQGKSSPDELTNQVSNKFSIDLTKYSEEVVQKFKRYIKYFQKVCQV
jgi:hypothetical protein